MRTLLDDAPADSALGAPQRQPRSLPRPRAHRLAWGARRASAVGQAAAGGLRGRRRQPWCAAALQAGPPEQTLTPRARVLRRDEEHRIGRAVAADGAAAAAAGGHVRSRGEGVGRCGPARRLRTALPAPAPRPRAGAPRALRRLTARVCTPRPFTIPRKRTARARRCGAFRPLLSRYPRAASRRHHAYPRAAVLPGAAWVRRADWWAGRDITLTVRLAALCAGWSACRAGMSLR